MQLSCPSCQHPVKAEDINLNKLIAKCASCHAVFRFSENEIAIPAPQTTQSEASPAQNEDPPAQNERRGRRKGPPYRPQRHAPRIEKAPERLLPKGMTLQQQPDFLRVHWRWFSPAVFFLLFFCIIWNTFVFGFISNGPKITDLFSLFFNLFPLIHATVGIVIAYITLAMFINDTTLTVQNNQLSIRHAPLPWWGNQSVRTDELEQLYCREHVSHTKNGTTYSYELHAILRTGKQLKLLSGLDDPEKVFFVEQCVEDHLGITDRAVPGEYKG